MRLVPLPYRRLAAVLLIALVTTLAAWLAALTSPLKTLEGGTLDWRFQFRGPRGELSPDIVLILIEEEADLPYRSPIPRRHLAQLIERLRMAKLIGLDVLLDRPSFDQEGDAWLKKACLENGRVIAVSYLEGGKEHHPHPYFGEALLDRGYATFFTESEVEVVREGTLFQELAEERTLSLTGCMYAHLRGLDTEALRSGGLQAFSPHRVLIDFTGPPNRYTRAGGVGPPGGFAVCPSHLVAAGVYPASFFQDKIVLIGSGLMDAPDRFRMPFFAAAYGYEKMYGVEIHAHLLRTLLEGERLRTWQPTATGLLIFLAVLLAALNGLFIGHVRSAFTLSALLLGLWVAGFALFTKGSALPLIAPTLGMLIAHGLATGYYALTEGREKRQMRRLFEKYLAPHVVEELLQNPDHWKLGGRSMEMTVMFADLEGFTPLCEHLSPEKVVELVNYYLAEMSPLIWMQGGTIDKYEGDLIMAFFGAPLPQTDHAVRACRAALQMQARLAQMRNDGILQAGVDLRVRIGLHSGRAVVGNMGWDYHFNYTVMGDTVNLAARLEQANKQFGTGTMVSETTRQQAGEEEFAYRSLGEIQVKGRQASVQVYELLPLTPAAPADPPGAG